MKSSFWSYTLLAAVFGGGVWAYTSHVPKPGDLLDRPLPPIEVLGETFHITVFGTSLTARYSWPEILGGKLEACLGLPVVVSVLAKPGAGSDWGTAQLENVLATSPDLVLLELAVNDADISDGLWLGKSTQNHGSILQVIRREESIPLLMMTTNPVHGLQKLRRPWLPSHYANYQNLAQKYDAGLADFYNRWLAQDGFSALLSDGLHPQQDAPTEIMVPVLSDQILAAMGKSCSD